MPYLDFTHAGCTFCGDCATACEQIPEKTGFIPDIGVIRLDEHKCLAMNGVLCMSCLRPCDQQALSLDKRRRPVVDENACNGCGACISVCPVSALHVTPGD
jgi:ferredoxin-type protein NapF